MYFQYSEWQGTWLNKCLESGVSKVHTTSNMVRETKHYSNMSHTAFTRFNGQCEGN